MTVPFTKISQITHRYENPGQPLVEVAPGLLFVIIDR